MSDGSSKSFVVYTKYQVNRKKMSQATRSRPAEQRSSDQVTWNAAQGLQQHAGDFQQMCDSVCSSVKSYSIKHPTMVASALFLAGFYTGWKVKPW
jgi:hypothetical protein